MESKYPEPELSLSRLLDPLERRLDSIAETNSRQTDATMLKQVDDVITKIHDIWRKAKSTKNSLAPVNRIPPETLALIAAFFEPGRQLINATAVCQHWRTTLLSFPRLWNKINCSDVTMFEAYLERSRSVPLEVQLHDISPYLFDSLAPHTSRLSSLTVWVRSSFALDEIARHLQNPIPTLHEFSVATLFGLDTLKISGIGNNPFLHAKKLCLMGLPPLRAPHVFSHVTELGWRVASYNPIPVAGLLDTMEQLPVLERVEILFETGQQWDMTNPAPRAVTLPHVQEMFLSCYAEEIPHILGFLKLPNLTSLVVDGVQESTFPTLPVTSFDEHLPNFVELPVMKVVICPKYGVVSFQSPSQASLDYEVRGQRLGNKPYRHDRKLWGGLSLHSVRKLVVELDTWAEDGGDAWLVSLLRDLKSLEHLELGGCCGHLIRYLRRMVMRGEPLPGITTLTMGSEYGYDIHQALRLKDVVDGLGLGIVVTCVQGPEMIDDEPREREADGLSESWDWSDKVGSGDEAED